MRAKNGATMAILFAVLVAALLALLAKSDRDSLAAEPKKKEAAKVEEESPATEELETATFAAGCFWCTEAVFEQLKGVKKVVSGYTGGSSVNPSYEEVCTDLTGHAEASQITYDPKVITYTELLEVFWETHDPTTLNAQGVDIGTRYRSAIFYHNAEQKQLAEHFKQKLDSSRAFPKPIVTEITEAGDFYSAEGYHQDYFANNPRQPYCAATIRPKVNKVKKVFHDKLK